MKTLNIISFNRNKSYKTIVVLFANIFLFTSIFSCTNLNPSKNMSAEQDLTLPPNERQALDIIINYPGKSFCEGCNRKFDGICFNIENPNIAYCMDRDCPHNTGFDTGALIRIFYDPQIEKTRGNLNFFFNKNRNYEIFHELRKSFSLKEIVENLFSNDAAVDTIQLMRYLLAESKGYKKVSEFTERLFENKSWPYIDSATIIVLYTQYLSNAKSSYNILEHLRTEKVSFGSRWSDPLTLHLSENELEYFNNGKFGKLLNKNTDNPFSIDLKELLGEKIINLFRNLSLFSQIKNKINEVVFNEKAVTIEAFDLGLEFISVKTLLLLISTEKERLAAIAKLLESIIKAEEEQRKIIEERIYRSNRLINKSIRKHEEENRELSLSFCKISSCEWPNDIYSKTSFTIIPEESLQILLTMSDEKFRLITKHIKPIHRLDTKVLKILSRLHPDYIKIIGKICETCDVNTDITPYRVAMLTLLSPNEIVELLKKELLDPALKKEKLLKDVLAKDSTIEDYLNSDNSFRTRFIFSSDLYNKYSDEQVTKKMEQLLKLKMN